MKIYYKNPQIIFRAILTSLLIMLSQNTWAIFGNTQSPKDAQEIISDGEKYVKLGLEGFEKVLKSNSIEKKDTVGLWESNSVIFAPGAILSPLDPTVIISRAIDDASTGQPKELTSPKPISYAKTPMDDSEWSKAREWEQNLSAFSEDIQTCGEVANWQLKTNMEIFGLKFDTEMAPIWIDLMLSVVREHSRYLTSVAQDIKRGSLSNAEIQKDIDEVKKIRNYMENISDCLVRRVEYLEKQHTMKAELDKRVIAILAIWGDMKARHPKVNSDLTSIPPTWVPLVKKHWEDYKEVRKKFDEAYGSLVAGTLFKDVPFFKDKKYGDLASPVISLENDLKRLLTSKTYE
jgi:hypothetical protein